MIGKLRGTVDSIGRDTAIVDVGGVGYEVALSARTLGRLVPGAAVTLAIETYVREDAIRLFGFASEAERAWFRLLQNVQGVGAKVALAVLGVLEPQQLASAIALGDRAQVARAPGVGPKMAARIVAELADKAPALMAAGGLSMPEGVEAARAPAGSAVADAVSALTNLGYAPAQAAAAVARVALEGASAETLIRAGLRELAK